MILSESLSQLPKDVVSVAAQEPEGLNLQFEAQLNWPTHTRQVDSIEPAVRDCISKTLGQNERMAAEKNGRVNRPFLVS